MEKFQNSIKKNLSCGEISEFYKEKEKVRMWRKMTNIRYAYRIASLSTILGFSIDFLVQVLIHLIEPFLEHSNKIMSYKKA